MIRSAALNIGRKGFALLHSTVKEEDPKSAYSTHLPTGQN